MSFDKYYPKRKDWRKPYRHSKKFDRSCRPGGNCPYCMHNRLHSNNKRLSINQIAIRQFFKGEGII